MPGVMGVPQRMRPPVRKRDTFTDLHPKLMVPSGGGFIASPFESAGHGGGLRQQSM